MDFKKVLQKVKLKSTASRLLVLKILSELKHPATAQEIHQRLKKIDLVTLYRTIASFEKKQLIKRIDLRKDAVHYELNIGHHHHIVCGECGIVEDFENKEIETALKKIIKKSSQFKNIQEHSLELFGLCRACA